MQTVLIRTVCDKLSRMFHDYINHLGSLHDAPTSTLSHINYLQLDSRSSKGVFILPHSLFLSLSLFICTQIVYFLVSMLLSMNFSFQKSSIIEVKENKKKQTDQILLNQILNESYIYIISTIWFVFFCNIRTNLTSHWFDWYLNKFF